MRDALDVAVGLFSFLRGLVLSIFFGYLGFVLFVALCDPRIGDTAPPSWMKWVLMFVGNLCGWALNRDPCRCRP